MAGGWGNGDGGSRDGAAGELRGAPAPLIGEVGVPPELLIEVSEG
jgi:hypothetical protein